MTADEQEKLNEQIREENKTSKFNFSKPPNKEEESFNSFMSNYWETGNMNAESKDIFSEKPFLIPRYDQKKFSFYVFFDSSY